MRARALFYVCAGIFLLALAYHLGARSATAQVPGFRLLGPSFVQVGETVYLLRSEGQPAWVPLPAPEYPWPLPAPPSRLVSLADPRAISDTGEGWVRLGDTWVSAGLLPGGSTRAGSLSWGSVKERYRN